MFSRIHLLKPSRLGLFLIGRFYDHLIQSLYYTADPWIPPHPQHSKNSACNFTVSPPHSLFASSSSWCSQCRLQPGSSAVTLVQVLLTSPGLLLFSSSFVSDSSWPMDYSTPGFPVHHYLLELVQTDVRWVSDAIQPTHPLSPPSPPAFSLSQHQGLFQWVGSWHQVA